MYNALLFSFKNKGVQTALDAVALPAQPEDIPPVEWY